MQLNGKVIRGVRKARTFWVALLAILFGFVFLGLGIYFVLSPDQGKTYENATATITQINSEMIGDEEVYYTIISFQDKEGVTHTDVRLDSYNSSPNKYSIWDFNLPSGA